jgi:hypothetical protein
LEAEQDKSANSSFLSTQSSHLRIARRSFEDACPRRTPWYQGNEGFQHVRSTYTTETDNRIAVIQKNP